MKELKQHILEKLKVYKNRTSDITIESLIDVLNDYKERNHVYAVYIDLKDIFEKYPTVLQYHGTYTDKNIIGKTIAAIGYAPVPRAAEKLVFVYFDRHIGDSIGSIRIGNTEDLHDVFDEEVLDKIYNYIVNH